MRFRNRLGSLTLGCVLLAGTVTPLLAAYTATLTVVENGTSAYTQVPIKIDADVSSWVSNYFIAADGLDVQVKQGGVAVPLMLADDGLYISDAITQGGTNNYTLSTGNTPVTSMPIILGEGGYVTTSDDASLELGDDFEIEFSGYIDTSTESSFITKGSNFDVSISGATDITATISALSGTENESQSSSDTFYDTYAAGYIAQTFIFANKVSVSSVSVYVAESTNPAGNFTAEIYATSAGKPTGSALASGSISAAGINTAGNEIISFTTPVILNAGVTYAVVFSAPTAASSVLVYVDTSSPTYANGSAVTSSNSGSTWTILTDWDLRFTLIGDIVVETSVTASGIASGEHTVKITADTTNLKLYIDGVEEDSVALAGASVIDNVNDWVLFGGNTVPYVDYYKHTVSSVLKSWYQPNTMIIPSSLTDRSGNGNIGVMTLVGNHPSITVTIGGIVASSTYTASSVDSEEGGEVIYTPGISVVENTSATGSNLPYYTIVNRAASTMGITTLSLYGLMVLFIALVVFVAVSISTSSQMMGLIGAGMVTGIGAAAIIGIWVVFLVAVGGGMLLYVYRRT